MEKIKKAAIYARLSTVRERSYFPKWITEKKERMNKDACL